MTLAPSSSATVTDHASLARLVPCLEGRPVPWDWDGFAVAQAQYATMGIAPDPEDGE